MASYSVDITGDALTTGITGQIKGHRIRELEPNRGIWTQEVGPDRADLTVTGIAVADDRFQEAVLITSGDEVSAGFVIHAHQLAH